MRHFYVITNEQKDPGSILTQRVKSFLEQKGCTVTLREKGSTENGDIHTATEQIPAETESILVLGGDGTILRAARDTVERELPVIGVNMGTLGYLAEIERDNLEEALLRLIRDDYHLEKRMMIHGEVCGSTCTEENRREGDALNDIVISRKGSLQIIQYNIYVNGQLLRSYSADGVIIATPTGSTGYNLSAGGPIVEPKAELMLVTPICPHTTNTRTIILSPEDEVTVEIAPDKEGEVQEVEANFDGSCRYSMRTGEKIRIVRSIRSTRFVKLDEESFLQVLHKKMC